MQETMVPDDLRADMMRVSELVPYAGNAKRHPDWQVGQIASSIRAFGFNDPIAVWQDVAGHWVVVEGHGRLLAARQLGMDEVPVIRLSHLDDEARRAYTLAHNKLTMNTDFDDRVLDSELGDIEGFDMAEFGFEVEMPPADDLFGIDSAIATELDERKDYVVIRVDSDLDWAQAQTVFGLRHAERWKTNANGSGGGDMRLCRVVTWEEFAERFLGGSDA